MNNMHVILGNQLIPIKFIKQIKPEIVFMREDLGLCTYEKHHKHKIILFLSAMSNALFICEADVINSQFSFIFGLAIFFE